MNDIPTGDCYTAAFNLLFDIMTNPDSEDPCLVHGTVTQPSNGNRIQHAWVELLDNVIDHSNGCKTEMDKSTYYAKLDVADESKYSPMIAMRMNATAGHYGPWPTGGE